MSPEFELIAKYFTRPVRKALLGIGDDSALISVSPGCELAVSTDTLACGTHFYPDADAEKLGRKALAVNLSDLAAMGALPRYVTLALTLPSIEVYWLAGFSRGFFALADEYGVELIGGDTTRGPLSITLTVMGEVGAGQALTRSGALDGDDIWVSGGLGAAALALRHLRGTIDLSAEVFASAAEKLHTPQPRVALGRALIGVATSAIDISDGLVADLAHLCECSRLSANILWTALPLSEALLAVLPEQQRACALTGGEDYELCFTAPQRSRKQLPRISSATGMALTRIGSMRVGEARVFVRDEHGMTIPVIDAGYDHFVNGN